MAVGPQGIVTFVGTRKTDVWAVTDRNKDRVADEVKRFAPSIDFAIPNGPCFSDDGFLYIAEQNRVLVYPAAEFFRSEEHTSELQSLMRISYAVFCLTKKQQRRRCMR